MYFLILFAALFFPSCGAVLSDQRQASRHLFDFLDRWQEFDLSISQSHQVMSEYGEWSILSRGKGSICRKHDRWRMLQTSFGIGSGGKVYGGFLELVSLENEVTLCIKRKAEKQFLPSIAEIRNDLLVQKWGLLKWKKNVLGDASVKLRAADEPNAFLRFERIMPLLTGTTDIQPEVNIVELIRTANSFTQKNCVFMEQECIEWTFEHEIGSGCVRVAPLLGYAPLYIRISKQPNQTYGGKRLSELGYRSVESTYQYRELDGDFSHFVFETETVVSKDTGGFNGAKTTFQCELVSMNVDVKLLELTSEITEGAEIPVDGAHQILAVWRNKQVVKDYDQDLIGEIETLEFANQVEPAANRTIWVLPTLLGFLVILVVTFVIENRKSTK